MKKIKLNAAKLQLSKEQVVSLTNSGANNVKGGGTGIYCQKTALCDDSVNVCWISELNTGCFCVPTKNRICDGIEP